VKQSASVEGSLGLYTITIPPGMLMCTNGFGAMRLLNRSRVTVWNYVKSGRLRSFAMSANIAVPLKDIAAVLGTTENQVYNAAISYRLPLWQMYVD